MGIFKKLFFATEKQEEEKEKIEKYSHALHQNTLICNACGKEILGTPRFQRMPNGDTLYFHKGCFRKMRRGLIPKV